MATESAKLENSYIVAMDPIAIAGGSVRLPYLCNPRRHYSDCDDREWSTAVAGIGSAG